MYNREGNTIAFCFLRLVSNQEKRKKNHVPGWQDFQAYTEQLSNLAELLTSFEEDQIWPAWTIKMTHERFWEWDYSDCAEDDIPMKYDIWY